MLKNRFPDQSEKYKMRTITINKIVLITGIAVVLINWNPLMKLDGYYILTELLDLVDLKEDSTMFVSAWVKSEELQSANGPRISVSDAYDDKPWALTQETVGTTPWHRLESSFQTGPETELLAIRFKRDPGNTRVKGKFWVDEVSLRPTVKSRLTEQ